MKPLNFQEGHKPINTHNGQNNSQNNFMNNLNLIGKNLINNISRDIYDRKIRLDFAKHTHINLGCVS